MLTIQPFTSSTKLEVINLYISTFSTGLSEQYIDKLELEAYIEAILEHGYSLLAYDNEFLIGALLSCPFLTNDSIPPMILNNYLIEKCVYVAEMMVKEEARGKGIGTALLNRFFQTIDKSKYSDAFIRVWEENTGAIALYEQHGFKAIGTVIQNKMTTDKKEVFSMRKIYLHKKLV